MLLCKAIGALFDGLLYMSEQKRENNEFDRMSEDAIDRAIAKIARDGFSSAMYFLRSTHNDESIIRILMEEIQDLNESIY